MQHRCGRRPRGRDARATAALAAIALVALTGCSGSARSANTAGETPVVESSTQQPAPSAAPASTPASSTASSSAASSAASSSAVAFDATSARSLCGTIVDEIGNIDGQLASGAPVGLAYSVLSENLDRLKLAGIPPHAQAASYNSALATLADLASAAYINESKDAATAATNYATLRANLPEVLQTINQGLGTNYALPPA